MKLNKVINNKKIFLVLLSVLLLSSMFVANLKAEEPIAPAGIGSTIQETFPDTNFAQAVADSVSSGDVNATLTQEMVDGLAYLFANDREISDLTGIDNLTSLGMLVLNNNQLTSIPPEIGNMTSLSFLNVNGNQLTSLPPEIGKLTSLSVLSASDNYLTSLPEEIGNLTALRNFDVSRNQLTSIPESLLTIVNMLGGLSLEGNLLPSDYEIIIQQNGNSHGHQVQDKLLVDVAASAVSIKNISDLDLIDYALLVHLQSGKQLSLAHNFILQNYVDENMQPVNINDYFSSNGNVKKAGKVYAQVRSTGTGVFNNTSDNALTDGYIELNFEVSYFDLGFDLNGGIGTIPVQSLIEGSLATEVNQPTRDGYTFKGWNTLQDGSGSTWNFASATMPANNVTLYAQWEEDTQTIVSPMAPANPMLPKTGDSSNAILFGASLVGAGALLLILRKRNVKNLTK